LQTGTTSYNSDLGFALNNGGLVTFIGGNNTPGPVVVELKDGQPLTFVSSTSTQTPISAWCAVVRTTLLVAPFPSLLAMHRSFRHCPLFIVTATDGYIVGLWSSRAVHCDGERK
jgi:hypothetical protein